MHTKHAYITHDIYRALLRKHGALLRKRYQLHLWCNHTYLHTQVTDIYMALWREYIGFFFCGCYLHSWQHHNCRIKRMGWLRLVGSLKLQVSFAEYRLFYRALLQKRPVILRSLLIVATLYLLPPVRPYIPTAASARCVLHMLKLYVILMWEVVLYTPATSST